MGRTSQLFSTLLISILLLSAFSLLLISSAAQNQFEIDCKGIVTKVVDGDTIYVYSVEGFRAGETFKVRFADINAPELGTLRGQDAKLALSSLIDRKEVILDIDDLYIYDRYGRVVAVIYLQVEESKLMNVNKWLVVNGYAEITDYNNEFNPFTWALYVEFKSPTTEGGTSQPIANIVINEVELNPPGLDSGNEWVELYNPNSQEVNIGGWSLTTTHGVTVTITIPEGTKIPPNSFYIVSWKLQWLDNEDESIILRDQNGIEVDRTPILSDTSNDDRTWQRIPNGKDTDSMEDWKFTTATKGTTNSEVIQLPPQDTEPPTVTNVVVTPSTGVTGTVFKIRATVNDPSGVKQVACHIFHNGQEVAGFELFDDGLHNDVSLNDGIYGNAWGSSGASEGTYYVMIYAQDNLGNADEYFNLATFTVTRITPALPTISIEGAVFIPPKELEEKIAIYRGQVSVSEELPSNSFVLLAKNGIYVVLSREKPLKSLAHVEGKILPKTLSWNGFSFTVIVADSVTFKIEGEPATINDIRANPEAYKLKLVKLETTIREISILTYSNDQPIVHLTSGIVTDEPVTLPNFLSNLLSVMKSLTINPSLKNVQNLVGEVREKRLPIFTYDDAEFWKDSTGKVDCIVLVSNENLTKFLNQIERLKDVVPLDEAILLYKVKTDLNPVSVNDVSEINSNPDNFLGKTVSFTANVYDTRISVRKLIEAETGGECPVDVILHVAVAWNRLPTTENDILLVLGSSSHEQADLVNIVDGVYKIEGKVVSAKKIDESLPEKPALLILRMEKVGEINYEALAVQAKNLIESKVTSLKETLEALILGKSKIPSMVNLVVRDLPESVVVNETFEVTLNYTAKVSAVGLIVTEYLPAGIKYIEAEPEPATVKNVSPPTQITEKLGFTVPQITMLKWLFYSKEPLDSIIIQYKAKYSPELLPETPRILPFHGEYEATGSQGKKYVGVTGGDITTKVEVGLPGPWDDDGKVTDAEILNAISDWSKGKMSDTSILKYIQLWIKTLKGGG